MFSPVGAAYAVGIVIAVASFAKCASSEFTQNAHQRIVRATRNRDPRYNVWTNPQRILFRMDPTYNSTQRAVIREAMEQVTDDTQACIRFEPYNIVTDSREDHIVITPRFNTGELASTCATFPGRLVRQNGAGQKLLIFGGNGGCMGTKRDLMSIIMPVLGLRQEYRRPDRDLHLRVFEENILPQFENLNLLQIYNRSQVNSGSTTFDFHSITMPQPSRFATPNTVLFTPRNASEFIGFLPRLSLGDCTALKSMYPQCARTQCSDPYANTTIGDSIRAVSASITANNVANSQLVSDGAGTVISAADRQAAVTKSTNGLLSLIKQLSATSTAAPRSTTFDLAGNQVGGPIDPAFGGLEFWLDPAPKKTATA